MTTTPAPHALIDEQLAAFNAKDLDRFVGCFVDEVVVRAFPSGDELPDRSGAMFRQRFAAMFRDEPGVTATLVSRVIKDGVVVDQEHMTGFSDGGERTTVALYQVGESLIEAVWFVV